MCSIISFTVTHVRPFFYEVNRLCKKNKKNLFEPIVIQVEICLIFTMIKITRYLFLNYECSHDRRSESEYRLKKRKKHTWTIPVWKKWRLFLFFTHESLCDNNFFYQCDYHGFIRFHYVFSLKKRISEVSAEDIWECWYVFLWDSHCLVFLHVFHRGYTHRS